MLDDIDAYVYILFNNIAYESKRKGERESLLMYGSHLFWISSTSFSLDRDQENGMSWRKRDSQMMLQKATIAIQLVIMHHNPFCLKVHVRITNNLNIEIDGI